MLLIVCSATAIAAILFYVSFERSPSLNENELRKKGGFFFFWKKPGLSTQMWFAITNFVAAVIDFMMNCFFSVYLSRN